MKPYAHVVDLVPFVDTCLRAGMLTGSHQAVPLFWFNELDGRGPTPVAESIREHQARVRELARRGIPVEMNDPNHFSSRWAHDAIVVADYATHHGGHARPGRPGPHSAIAIQQAARDERSWRPGQDARRRWTSPRRWRSARTAGRGCGARPARASTASPRNSTRPAISWRAPPCCNCSSNPHAIHLVSYCEAIHVAGVADVIDSSRLVRRCVRVFREHQAELESLKRHPLVVRAAHVNSFPKRQASFAISPPWMEKASPTRASQDRRSSAGSPIPRCCCNRWKPGSWRRQESFIRAIPGGTKHRHGASDQWLHRLPPPRVRPAHHGNGKAEKTCCRLGREGAIRWRIGSARSECFGWCSF